VSYRDRRGPMGYTSPFSRAVSQIKTTASAHQPVTTTSSIDEVVDLLRTLRLSHMRAAAPDLLAIAKAQRWEPAEAMRPLLTEELAGRQSSSVRARRKAAGFPTGQDLRRLGRDRQLDSRAHPTGAARPGVDPTSREPRRVRTIRNRQDPHFCEALGHAAVDAGHKVSWFSLEHLGALVRRHSADDIAAKAIKRIMRADVIVIDDIGLLPVTTDTAEALYRVVGAAYEKRSIALSSNLHPAGFDEFMPKTIANATVDRPHRRRQYPPHPSHRRKGGDATDQLNCGQNTWPPVGNSAGRHWAVLLAATGQIPLAIDSDEASARNLGQRFSGRRRFGTSGCPSL